MIKSFKEIQVWQKSHQLVLQIYSVTEKFPHVEIYGLVSQMRRSAVSIPSNIAEGHKRESTKDSLHFYNTAESSLEELKYQTLLARDLEYIKNDQYEKLSILEDEIGKMLHGWKKSQKF